MRSFPNLIAKVLGLVVFFSIGCVLRSLYQMNQSMEHVFLLSDDVAGRTSLPPPTDDISPPNNGNNTDLMFERTKQVEPPNDKEQKQGNDGLDAGSSDEAPSTTPRTKTNSDDTPSIVIEMKLVSVEEAETTTINDEHTSSTIHDRAVTNTTTPADTSHNWTQPPKWITDYVAWHHNTRLEYANLTDPENLPPMLVVYCRAACGGLHDRLGSLPFDFYAANQTRRLLFYMWRVPVNLEEFLMPPPSNDGGYFFDWRVPDHLRKLVDGAPSLFAKGHGGGTSPSFWNETLPSSIASIGRNHSLSLITLKDRFHNGEFFLEDKLRELGETDMIHLTPTFGWLWNRVFTPSPRLSEYIQNAKDAMGIESGKYVAVHCRIHYPLLLDEWFGKKSHPIRTVDATGGPDTSGIVLEGPGKEFGVGIGLHAIQCARTLLQNDNEPIYFFADANNLVEYLTRNVTDPTTTTTPLNQLDMVDVQAQPILERVHVVTRPDIHQQRNYHIDQTRKKNPRLYYALFADLYLAMDARCILFGYGGFGRFAQQLTANQCYLQHQLHIHDPFFGHSLNMHDNVCTNETYRHLTTTTTATAASTTTTAEEIKLTEKLLGNSIGPLDEVSRSDTMPSTNSTTNSSITSSSIGGATLDGKAAIVVTAASSIESNQTSNVSGGSSHNSTDDDWRPPRWITEYMEWHREMRLMHANLTDPTGFPPVLVVLCDVHCGGLHDRLGSLPFEFYAANQTRRLLFYMWRVPVDLEEFLVPPDTNDVFDWRVPELLRNLVDEAPTLLPEHHRGGTHAPFWSDTLPSSITETGRNHSIQILTLKDSFHNGEIFFEDKLRELGETDMIHLTPTFGWLWNQLFTPSPRLSQYINQTKAAMGTSPGNYVAVHCRIHYPRLLMNAFQNGPRPFGAVGNPDRKGMVLEGTMKEFGVGVGLHAVQCAQTLLRDESEPIYFFSDANNLVEYMTQSSTSSEPNNQFNQSDPVDVKAQRILENVNIITRPDIHQRNYHIDLATINDPSVYFALFADLYLAMEARCVVFGYGGFGRFAQQLTGNKCYLQHQLHIHKPYYGHSLNMHDNVCTNETYGTDSLDGPAGQA